MARSSTPGKQGRHSTLELDLRAPTTDNGTSTPPPPPPLVPSPLQCLHKGAGESEQQGFKLGAYACGRLTDIQKSWSHQHSSDVCSVAAENVSQWCQETVRNQSTQCASPVVHPQQQSRITSNASSLLKWRSHRTPEQSPITRNPLRQNADIQDAGRINKTQVQKRTVLTESHGCKRHRTTSSVSAVSECDTQRH